MKKYSRFLCLSVAALFAASCASEKIGTDSCVIEETVMEGESDVVSATVSEADLLGGVKIDGSIKVDLSSVPATRSGLALELQLIATNTSEYVLSVTGDVVIDGQAVAIMDEIPALAHRTVVALDDEGLDNLLQDVPGSITIENIVVTGVDKHGNKKDILDDITVSLEGIVTVPMT